MEQANSLRAAGSYEEAIQLYTKAIHINERIGGYAGRAYCRFLLGDYEQAERDANTSMYNRSAKDLMQPGMMGMAEYVRGVCRYRRGQFTEAEADLPPSATLYDTHMVENGGLAQITHSGEGKGCTWESLAQENIRQQEKKSYNVKVIPGLPDDYRIVPTSNPWMYRLDYIDGSRTLWLYRIDVQLPLLQ